MHKILMLTSAAICWLVLAAAAGAQQVLGIAAVVNDQVISAFDLEERLDLIVVSANLPQTEDTRRRLREEALRSLIDETLQMQAAHEVGITVTNGEIDAEFARLAERNEMTAATLSSRLEASGVDVSTLRRQILATIAWERFVSSQLLRAVDVSDEEIDEVERQIEDAKGEKSYLVSEIVLPVETPAREPEVRELAERLVRQIRNGANFAALAEQFSAGATASLGGDVGWVRAGQMGEAVSAALPDIPPGNVSEPISTTLGIVVIAVRETRVIGQADISAIEVELSQVLFPLPASASESEIERVRGEAGRIRSEIDGCASVDEVASSVEGAQGQSLGSLQIGDLPEQFQGGIAQLAVGEVSQPIRTPSGLHLLVVCNRSQPVAGATVDRQQIRNDIIVRKLNQRALGRLRDLRRDAIIDYR